MKKFVGAGGKENYMGRDGRRISRDYRSRYLLSNNVRATTASFYSPNKIFKKYNIQVIHYLGITAIKSRSNMDRQHTMCSDKQ